MPLCVSAHETSYTYHATKKRAVIAAGSNTYGYDANGNMTTRNGSGIGYTSYNLPNLIMSGSNSSTLSYGAHRNRYRQVSVASGVTETTIYVGGLLEKVTRGSVTEYRHLIHGGKGVAAIYTRPTSGAATTYYVHADHLGSPELITNSAGAQVVKLSFGAYGERRGSDWSGTPSSGDWTAIGNTTRDGFTGHEHLDAVSLIHMNGRVYDPVVGRFLSADPVLDLGLGAQSANRYSYVGNRPLSFVDPSGYNCEAPEGMSDDEASDYITRCNDAYDSGGWGAIRENERWCASLDFDCQQRNHQQTLASAIDALVAAGITPGLYEAILDNNGRMPNLPTLAGGEASGVMVTASRLGGSARYAWYTYTGLAPGTTRLIKADMVGGGTGWVAARDAEGATSSADVGSAVAGAIGVSAAVVEHSSGVTTVGSNFRIYPSGWWGNSVVTTRFLSSIAQTVGIAMIPVQVAFDSYRGLSGPHVASNLGVGVWAMSAGPYSATIGAFYFGIDNLYPGGMAAGLTRYGETSLRMQATDPLWNHPGAN